MNQRPTPLSPAGKAIRMRGSFPERSTRCAATSPSRTRRLVLRPSSTWKSRRAAVGSSPRAGAAVSSPALTTIATRNRAMTLARMPVLMDGPQTRARPYLSDACLAPHHARHRIDDVLNRMELRRVGQQCACHGERAGLATGAQRGVLNSLEVDHMGEADDAADHFAGSKPDHVGKQPVQEGKARRFQRTGLFGSREHGCWEHVAMRVFGP